MPQVLPWYTNLIIAGNDEEGEGEEGEESESDEESEEESEEGEGSGEEKPDVDGLKSALSKERKGRREAERELRKLKRTQDEHQQTKDEESSEVKKTQAQLEAERTKSVKLADRLQQTAVDNLILRFAGTQFADTDDVLKLIDRADIDVDQDEDDPSDITIDEDTVKDAVKKLAKAKPHLLKIEGENGETGGQFGGRKKTGDEMSEEALMARYPAIQKL